MRQKTRTWLLVSMGMLLALVFFNGAVTYRRLEQVARDRTASFKPRTCSMRWNRSSRLPMTLRPGNGVICSPGRKSI